MGICQSRLNGELANAEFVVKDDQRHPLPSYTDKLRHNGLPPRKFTFGRQQSAASVPSVRKNGLISPSEGTETTEPDSPHGSIFSSPYTPVTTNELMDIDDASSAATEEGTFSEQYDYSSYRDSHNLLLGDHPMDEDDDIDYRLTEDVTSPTPLKRDTPTFKTYAAGVPPIRDSHNLLLGDHPMDEDDGIDSPVTREVTSPTPLGRDTPTFKTYAAGVPPAPLLAPPKDVVVTLDPPSVSSGSSVNPQTLARFNKLKTQARLAAKLERQRKQKEKAQDRRLDIEGYKNLWEEYSGIQTKVSDQHDHDDQPELDMSCRGSKSISLHDSATWFVVRCGRNVVEAPLGMLR
jgi:hypothetical protein